MMDADSGMAIYMAGGSEGGSGARGGGGGATPLFFTGMCGHRFQ